MTNQKFAISGLDIHQAGNADNKGSKWLQEAYVEGGRVSTKISIKVDAANSALDIAHPGNYRLLAYVPGVEMPVGTIAGWPHQVRLGTHNIYPAVLVHRLAVHPDYRKQGVAKALWQELEHWIKNTYGGRAVVYGYFQKGNEASQAWFKSIGGNFTDLELVVAPVKTITSGKSASGTNYKIVLADKASFEEIVAGINEFYKDYSLYKPASVQEMEEWLGPKNIGGVSYSLSRYYITTGSNGSIVAGIGIFDLNQLFDIKVVEMPPLISFLNKFLKIIPEDGSLKPLQVSRAWYKTGEVEAARILWREVRRRESAYGRSLIVDFDPSSSLQLMFSLPKLQPTTRQALVILASPDNSQPISHPLSQVQN